MNGYLTGGLLLLFISTIIHEIMHYLIASLLNYNPKFRVSFRGLSVHIEAFDSYRKITDIIENKKKKDYIMIASAPYSILPIYFLLYTQLSMPYKIVPLLIITYHIFSLPLEFFQEKIVYIGSVIFMNILILLSFLY